MLIRLQLLHCSLLQNATILNMKSDNFKASQTVRRAKAFLSDNALRAQSFSRSNAIPIGKGGGQV
jgi:hypothetical protein